MDVSEAGKLGAIARFKATTPEKRSEIARKAQRASVRARRRNTRALKNKSK